VPGIQTSRTAGLLTERTRHQPTADAGERIQATKPGEPAGLDTFYVGNLKGVVKVW